ncbi:MAG: NAD(P)H-dependent oxidoreductase [Candidatus Omnitrophica bacterium]|nr:NAD(P)H-dependent oxidoreductase [Candidatus Omnitrophota bacterium]
MSTQKHNGIISPEVLLQQLRWRYAVKKFDVTRKIPADIWHALEKTLVLSPSSFGLQPWKFIVVQDPALRERLLPVSWKQSQIVDASHLVAFAHKKDMNAHDVERYVKHTAKVREIPAESLEGYKQLMLGFVGRAGKGFDINDWAARQLYIALGNFLTASAVLGIDTCPIEGIDPKQYDEILGLDKQGYHVVFVAAAGYRSKEDASAAHPKVRYAHEDVVEYR